MAAITFVHRLDAEVDGLKQPEERLFAPLLLNFLFKDSLFGHPIQDANSLLWYLFAGRNFIVTKPVFPDFDVFEDSP